MQISYPALDGMRLIFLERCPGFADFGMPSGVYFESEREYKQPILEAFAQITSRGGGQTDGEVGDLLLKAMLAPPANFVGWRTAALFTAPERRAGVAAVLGGMVRSGLEAGEAVQQAAREVYDLLQPVAQGAIFGGVRTLVTTALAFAKPDQAVSVKTRYMAKAAKELTGNSIFHKNHVTGEEYRGFLALCGQVRERLEDWGWRPLDLWDVQGFLWVVSQDQWRPAKPDTGGGKRMQEPQRYALNTILAGPPGTGKTYRTAEMAVGICEGDVHADRKEVMAAYRRLQDANRVVFTTSHQSMSYEEFVEGLRPVAEEEASIQGEDERPSAARTGLRLEARNGIFRDLCTQAEAATRRTGKSAGFALEGRSFYKMSLGQRWVEEDVYQAALDGNYVVLGWGGDLDWSDPKVRGLHRGAGAVDGRA